MAPPTWLASASDEYFTPPTTVAVHASATFFVAQFQDAGSADNTSGFTLGGEAMTKLLPYFPNTNGFYAAYKATPLTGARLLTFSGVEASYASASFTTSFSGVGSVISSGAGYLSPATGQTVYSVTVSADASCIVLAAIGLPAAQRAATITPLSGCTVRADVSGDARHMIVTAPGVGVTTIGVTSSVANFASFLMIHTVVLSSSTAGLQYVKMLIKLRGQ